MDLLLSKNYIIKGVLLIETTNKIIYILQN